MLSSTKKNTVIIHTDEITEEHVKAQSSPLPSDLPKAENIKRSDTSPDLEVRNGVWKRLCFRR